MDKSDIVENYPAERRSDERATMTVTLRQWRVMHAVNGLLVAPHALDSVDAVIAKAYEIADAQRRYENAEREARKTVKEIADSQFAYAAEDIKAKLARDTYAPPTIPEGNDVGEACAAVADIQNVASHGAAAATAPKSDAYFVAPLFEFAGGDKWEPVYPDGDTTNLPMIPPVVASDKYDV